MSPQIKGIKERKHRPFFGCHLCDKDMHLPCPHCRVWLCGKHLKDHDCVKVLLGILDARMKALEDYDEEFNDFEKEIDRQATALFKTLDRVKKIVIYHDRPEVQEALKLWDKGDDGETDWLEPPAGVDAILKELP